MAKKGENIYKRKDGRWEGRYKVGNKYVSVYAKTYRDVKQKLTAAKSSVTFPVSKISLSEMAQVWLKHIKSRVKESTYTNYTYLIKRHIEPYFKNIHMNALNKSVMSKFIDDKLNNGRLKRKGGISAKYLRDIISVIKSIALFCEDEYEIPCKIHNISLPKIQKQESKTLSPKDTKQLTSELIKIKHNYHLAALISLYTGLRLGEVCGLKWSDFDANKNTVTVQRTVQRISDNKGSTRLLVGSPKTSSSLRSIPLPPFLSNILKRIRSKPDYCIISQTSLFPEPMKVRAEFKHLLSERGIAPIRFHDLRHTFASNCLQLGFDIKTLSEILGHANTSMTLNRYVHSSDEVKRHCMNLIKIE